MNPVHFFLSGLLVGIAWAHGVRFATFDESKVRKIVALGGIVLYGLAAILCLVRATEVVGLAIALGGPVVGFTVVLASRSRVDTYQKAWGAMQMFGMVLAFVRLVEMWHFGR